jgi:AraC-like DNA-binding protein
VITSKMYLPSTILQDWIKVFWFMESDINDAIQSRLILPDGCATILLILKGKMLVEEYNSSVSKGIYVVPPISKFHKTHVSEDSCIIDIQLKPGIFTKLFNIPVEKLELKFYDIKELSLNFDYSIIEQLFSCLNNKYLMIKLLNNYFTELFYKKDFQKDSLIIGLSELYKKGNLDSFFYEQKLSIRQIQRKVKEFTGLSPKEISKIARFYNVLSEYRYNAENMKFAQIAQKNNYTDQSHFIKEFKSFTSKTPKSFLCDSEEYAQFMGLSKINNCFLHTI